MSLEARRTLVASARTLFMENSQRADLLNPNVTNTKLIGALIVLVAQCSALDVSIEFTAIKSDHRDDRDLGEHCHFNGFCCDFWFVKGRTPGNWVDANDPLFAECLRILASVPYIHEIGLAGTAYTQANMDNAREGDCKDVFQDDGGDHIHLGVA